MMYGATTSKEDLLRKALVAAPHATHQLIEMAQKPQPTKQELEQMRDMGGAEDPGIGTGAKVGIGVAVVGVLGLTTWAVLRK